MESLNRIIVFIFIIVWFQSNAQNTNNQNNPKNVNNGDFLFPNLYWPGTFENALYGGNFSSALNVSLCDTVNYTLGGKRSWYLKQNTYQHLELLTQGKGTFLVRFQAKATNAIQIVVKGVYKAEDNSSKTEDFVVDILGDNQWHLYEKEFVVTKPYPGPRTGEVLITSYNPGGVDAWIDNLEVLRNSPDEEELIQIKGKAIKLLKNAHFENGCKNWFVPESRVNISDQAIITYSNGKEKTKVLCLSLTESNSVPAAAQIIEGKSLANKTIRISARVSFLSISEDASSWSGLLFSLKNGNSADSELISSIPSPHWYVLGLSSPPGCMTKVSAIYKIPKNASKLFFEIAVQNGIKQNRAIVDDILIEVLPDK